MHTVKKDLKKVPVKDTHTHHETQLSNAPIHYLLNDPTTPNLAKDVTVPATPVAPNFVVTGYQGGGFAPNTQQGQAANVMVTLVNSLAANNSHSEKKMTTWAKVRSLAVLPRAGKMFNAYYDRRTLSFFYDKDQGGITVYTADSTDVVAHELGHAILDFYRPDLWNLAYMEAWAFHEAFGDINAFFSILQHEEVVNFMLKETGGDLNSTNVASRMAEQFGRAIWTADPNGRDPHYLRNLYNDFKYIDPTTLPSDSLDNVLCAEPHSFSRVMSGTIYEIFVMVYKDQLKKVPPVQAVKNARDIVHKYVLKAIMHTPAKPAFYESFARTMLWVDWTLPRRPYHDRMWDIFVNRNVIKPVSALSSSYTPKVLPLTKINLSHHITSDVRALSATKPIYDVEVVVSSTNYDSVDAAHHMVTFLYDTNQVGPHEDTPFEISNGTLVRSHFACLSQPTKFQPEFLKPYKPQNNNGCGCGRKTVEVAVPAPAKTGCFVRYRVVK